MSARWELSPYAATAGDLAFARRFVEWNGIARGIERVDACRTREGGPRDVHVKNLP